MLLHLCRRTAYFSGRNNGDKHAVSLPRDLRMEPRQHAWDASRGPSPAASQNFPSQLLHERIPVLLRQIILHQSKGSMSRLFR